MTKNCIVCGEEANYHHGHVINGIEKILAGFCINHHETIESDINGCYGEYSEKKMGTKNFIISPSK